MYQRVCAIRGCFNSSNACNESFYDVKLRPEVALAWEMLCDDAMVKNSPQLFVCSAHFGAEQFRNASCKSKGVRRFAIPTVNLGLGHVEEDVPVYQEDDVPVSAYVTVPDVPETDSIPLNNNGLSQKKAKKRYTDHDYAWNLASKEAMLRYIEKADKRYIALKDKLRIKSISDRRSKISAQKWRKRAIALRAVNAAKSQSKVQGKDQSGFLEELQDNVNRPAQGVRYSAATKNIAISLFYCSPKCYRELRKLLRLPSPRIIKKWLQGLHIEVGFSGSILSLMTNEAKGLKPQQKIVVMSIDEISLKRTLRFDDKSDTITGFPTVLAGEKVDISKRASSALVVNVTTLETNRKQCIAYFFSANGFKADQLKMIVERSVDKISAAGFTVKAIVLDQNSTNRSLYAKLRVSEETPFFVRKEQKIFCFYDPPHLIKSTRNNLMHHGAVYRKNLARWEHIRNLYEVDRKRRPRACPKLTQKHLYLPAFGEMKVNIAAQNISNGTSAGINLYVDEGVLPPECKATAVYCKDFNDLFDTFNASASSHQKSKFAKPLTHNSPHWKFMEKMKRRLKSLRFVHRDCASLAEETKHPKLTKASREPWFIQGWLLNISAVKGLFHELGEEYGIKELATRTINQDGLENFFGIIRMRNWCNTRPDCSLFRSAYRSAVVNQLLSSREKANCEEDPAINMFDIKDFAHLEISVQKPAPAAPESEQVNCNLDVLEVGQIHNSTYAAVWLFNIMSHQQCIQNLQTSRQVPSLLAELKGDSSSVSEHLLDLVRLVEQIFKNEFESIVRAGVTAVKARLGQKVAETAQSDLGRAKLKEMEENMQEDMKSKKKEKTKERLKAQRMNIE